MRIVIGTLGTLALAIVSLPSSAQVPANALGPVGTVWGGPHVKLEVTADGATLEFDCANGFIFKPVELNGQGNFSTSGNFTQEHGGPITRDGNPSVSATYSGSIQGNTLKLIITTGPQNESVGEYVLYRGKPGRVMKCR
jgi:hypothetical protein